MPNVKIHLMINEALLEIIALSAVQSFPRLLIHNAILFINTALYIAPDVHVLYTWSAPKFLCSQITANQCNAFRSCDQ